MNRPIEFKTTTSPLLIALALVLACFGLSPKAQGVVPAPDGGYANGNTAEGTNSLFSLTTGIWNTALGFEALNKDTAGGRNTATGLRALFSDTTGSFNTATGLYALYSNTIGWYNCAIGANTLSSNITGQFNTAIGYGALNHSDADNNTAVGFGALFKNTTGGANVAVGPEALNQNSSGGSNNAFGFRALFANTTGPFNNAHGVGALSSNTTGLGNNAFGDAALDSNVTGDGNTAIGDLAGISITGSGNVCIGANVSGVAGEDNTTRIKNVYATVQPVVGTDPDTVTVNSSGRLGRGNVSSQRYKHDIKPMDKASEALFALKPVSFRYNKEFDPTQTLAFGLIAEEVAEVFPDLVGRNPEGQPESVRYEQINAMLLNEFLKEHSTVEELKSTVAKQQTAIAQQQKAMETLNAQLKEQAAQILKVNAKVEVSSPSRQQIVRSK